MDTDDVTHRSVYEHPGDLVEYREAEEIEDETGMMAIRMPIASTGEVRNEGDDPLTASELRGMATQVNSETRGVFPEHGMSNLVDDGKYSQFEKLGYWSDADLQREASDDGEDLLMATARMPDPETLPAATGAYRTGLAILKEQAKRGIPIMSSIGWRDDGDSPGGVDLLETSIVGIAADPRTNTEDDAAEVMARSAIAAGADPDELLATVRAAVRESTDTDESRPFGPPGGDPNQWDDHEECVAEVEDWDTIDDPDAFCAWAKDQTEQSADRGTSMPDDPPAEDSGGTDTDDEQTADGGETTERAPDDVTLQDFAALLAPSLEDADADALLDAWEGFEYVGSADMGAVAAFVGTVTGNDADAAAAALEDLMDTDDGSESEYDEDKEEEDDESEQSAETDDQPETDGEQSAETEDDDSDEERAAALESRLDELESELQAVRSGETDIQSPGDDDSEDTEERDAETDDADADADDSDQRDSDGPTLRDEWLADTGGF